MTPIIESIQLLDISDAEYFGSSYKNYISNSRLKLINPDQGGSPQIYKEGLSGSSTPSLALGSAVHCRILQPNDFVIAPLTTKPTAKLGLMADALYSHYCEKNEVTVEEIIEASNKVDYYKGKINDQRVTEIITKCQPYWDGRRDWETRSQDSREAIFLDAKMWDAAHACIKSIENNKEIHKLLYPIGLTEDPFVLNEGTLLMDVKAIVDGHEVILKLKAKLDSFTINKETNTIILNDLKTTGHLLVDFGNGSFQTYHYARQGAGHTAL